MNAELVKKHRISIEGNIDAEQTIVFAHGFGTDQNAWEHVKRAFAADYRLLLYDNVGAGSADINAFSPIKYNSIFTYADDLLAIADDFKLENAIIVAHSVSGMIAMLAAIKAPHHFSKMVFIGASPRYLNDEGYVGGFTQDALDAMYETMRTNYYAWVSGFSTAAMGNADKPELGEDFAGTLGAIRPDIALSVAKVIFESDVRHRLSEVKKEILLIHAHNDIAVPVDVAEYLNRNIRGSRLVFVDAEGHFPHMSAPAEVISAIKDFI